MLFLAAGASYRERAFLSANRIGKSYTAAFEVALHLTGRYPKWWKGKVFDEPVSVICIGVSHNSVVKTAQTYLCGKGKDFGTGMIPLNCFDLVKHHPKAKQGIADAVSTMEIRHYTDGYEDGWSQCDFLSYEQGTDIISGTTRHVVWSDEQSKTQDPTLYSELVMRTATVGGVSILTYTPRHGMTELVQGFLDKGQFPKNNVVIGAEGVPKWVTNVTFSDPLPHLDEQTKKEMIASMQPWEIEARTMGYPSAGVGRIYTVSEADCVVPSFNIPAHWPRCYGLDIALTGFTACVWIAIDPYSNVAYVYDVYKCSNPSIAIHASAIRRRGKWIPGVIDPSAKRKKDGVKEWFQLYKDEGLDLTLADNKISEGIATIRSLEENGLLKYMSHCSEYIEERRSYSFDEKGEPAKNQRDDCLDAGKYAIRSGIARAIVQPDADDEKLNRMMKQFKAISRDPITGY